MRFTNCAIPFRDENSEPLRPGVIPKLRKPVQWHVIEAKQDRGEVLLRCDTCGAAETFAPVFVNRVKHFAGYADFFKQHTCCLPEGGHNADTSTD